MSLTLLAYLALASLAGAWAQKKFSVLDKIKEKLGPKPDKDEELKDLFKAWLQANTPAKKDV